MEDLSRKIHPSSEWDFIRESKLYSCFQHWHNSYYMMAALDAPEGRFYKEVKRVAMRLKKLQFDSNTQLRFQKRGLDRQDNEPQKTSSFNTTIREQGIDLDDNAHIVGDGKQRRLFDASGNSMSFLQEITTEVMVIGASTACVHLHVQQSNDDTLSTGDETNPEQAGVCQVDEGKAELSVISKGPEPWVIGRGEDLGRWSTGTWVDPRIADVTSYMMILRQPAVLKDAERIRVLLDILNKIEKLGSYPMKCAEDVATSDTELTQTDLVTHDIDVGDHPPIRQKTRPVLYGYARNWTQCCAI
ncbi:hypothetical protein COOONC_00938 [Cooperia oncophora]